MATEAGASAPNWELSLTISGEALRFDDISDALGLLSTDTRVKGELLNRLPPVVSQEDCWCYEVQLADNEGLDPRMQALLAALEKAAPALAQLRLRHEVTLRLSVQSDYAQIFYRLMPDTLARLARIGLPLEVSVVSWGALSFQAGGEEG
ncbi:MAG: DUF4279 domain-containing protein [Oscillospiraceae bacterium]|nr:DUF4279 domain-containing protein [Oscillospiraceae bacterium]